MVLLQRELSLSTLYLNGKSIKLFYLSAWRQVHPYILLVTRIFILVYSIIFMSLAIYSYGGSTKWLLHITTWNYILSTLYFGLVIAIAVKELVREERRSSYSIISISPRETEDGAMSPPLRTGNAIPIILVEGKELLFNYDSDGDTTDDDFVDIDDDEISVGYRLPFFYKFTYCIFNVSGNLAIVIAIAYWSMLHNYDVPIYLNLTSYAKIDASVIILFWMLLEIVLNDIPIRLLHFVFPMGVTIVYFIVYTIYTVCSGTTVYKTVNISKKPLRSGLILVTFLLAIVLVQVFLFFLERTKRVLADKLNKLKD